MTTCYSEKFGIYHNDVPLDGDSIIQDKPFDGPGDYVDGAWVELPVPVPQSVSRAQGKAALFRSEHLPTAQAAVDAAVAAGNIEVGIFWNEANTFERNSPFVTMLADAIPLTDAQIDDLFVLADSIGRAPA